MASFDIYTTDANPRHVYPNRQSGDVDRWVDQLARVSTGPVDLFVDVPDSRAVWTFRATKQDTSSRTNRYLADYRGSDRADLFDGLYTELSKLSTSGVWELSDDDDQRWSAGFDLAELDEGCPGLSPDEEDALVRVTSGDAPQVVLGMSSYAAALRTLKWLTMRGIDGTVAINSHGATPETEGIDLVLWPNGDRDFQPMTAETKELLSRVGFRREADMTVADATPSESITEVKHQRETPSPLEAFLGDTAGRIGALLSLFFTSTAFASLASVGPLYPLSGLSAIGGTVGAVVGLVAVQQFTQSDAATDGGVTADSGVAGGQMLSTANWDWQQYAAFSGYWLTFAYAFPTLFRLAGWPFGETIRLGTTIPSALVYGGALLLVSLLLYGGWALRSDSDGHAAGVGSLVVLHALFTLGLVALNGLACSVWYGLIGFSGAC